MWLGLQAYASKLWQGEGDYDLNEELGFDIQITAFITVQFFSALAMLLGLLGAFSSQSNHRLCICSVNTPFPN